MHHLDVIPCHETFQQLQREVVRARMKIDGDRFLPQRLRMGEGRVWADEDGLTGDGGAPIDAAPASGRVARAPALAPRAGVDRWPGLFFTRGMPPGGLDLRPSVVRGADGDPLPGPQE